MVVSKGHFKATMTRGAQADQVIEDISFVLKFKVATTFDVVNVKVSTAWAALYTTVTAYLVALDNLHPDFRPVAPMRQLFTAAPVGAIPAYHVGDSAISGTKLAASLDGRRERSELFAAMLTGRNGVLACSNRLTFPAAILRAPLHSGLATNKACLDLHKAVCGMARTAAKVKRSLPFLYSVSGALELFSAMAARQGDVVSTVGATLRAMINGSIVGFELFTAVEASLVHSSC
jgi:hypothetical protein